MSINTSVVSFALMDADVQPARFTISIFGIPYSKFMVSPGGGNILYEALSDHRGDGNISLLEMGYRGSPFMVRDVPERELAPMRIRRLK